MYTALPTPLAQLRVIFFFFNDTATTEIYTLSLHDALPISTIASMPGSIISPSHSASACARNSGAASAAAMTAWADRKSTRLNSSHTVISYAVFCLKKKKVHDHIIGTNADFCACDVYSFLFI